MVTEPVLVRSGAIARNRWRSGIVATQTLSGRQLRKPEIRRIVGEQVGATLPLERLVRGRTSVSTSQRSCGNPQGVEPVQPGGDMVPTRAVLVHQPLPV